MRDDLTSIEIDLTLLGNALEYPPTPEMAARVSGRISRGGETARGLRQTLSFVGSGLAAVVTALAAIVALVAPAREVIADLFDRIDIFTTAEVPPDLPTDVRGDSVTLEEAQERFGLRILLPAGPDDSAFTPSRIVYQDFGAARPKAVTLSFETAGGVPFAIMETDGGIGRDSEPERQRSPL